MEERTIIVDLTTAKQWYKEGGFKKELALKAYTNKELKEYSWKDIKTFEDAIQALNICPVQINMTLTGIPKQAKTIMMLSIIKKALNGDWNPSLNEGTIYYSWCRWYPKGDTIPAEWNKIADFRDTNNDKVYTLVDGGDYDGWNGGLGSFGCGYGDTFATLGLLGCKSREIAKHLTKYFGKIVFEAIYGQYNNYEWC